MAPIHYRESIGEQVMWWKKLIYILHFQEIFIFWVNYSFNLDLTSHWDLRNEDLFCFSCLSICKTSVTYIMYKHLLNRHIVRIRRCKCPALNIWPILLIGTWLNCKEAWQMEEIKIKYNVTLITCITSFPLNWPKLRPNKSQVATFCYGNTATA